jgi:type III secretion protein L
MPSLGQLLHRFRRLRLPPGAPGWAVAVPTVARDPSAEVAQLRGALDALADERAAVLAAARADAARREGDAGLRAERIVAAADERAEAETARVLDAAAAAAEAEAAAILAAARSDADAVLARAHAREEGLVARLVGCVLEGRP